VVVEMWAIFSGPQGAGSDCRAADEQPLADCDDYRRQAQ
jgi:hypothetical protein